MSTKTYDLTTGQPRTVLWKFCLPLFASVIFQQFYNIADSFVAGKFIGENALAAVGNSYEITLIFIAFATGCNMACSVLAAQFFGAKKYNSMKTAIYTAMISVVILCVILMLFGIFSSDWLLQIMNTPEEIFGGASTYLGIIFAGFCATMAYNVFAAILRAIGDTKRPLYYLTTAGVVNVILNLVFVIGLDMSVAGVALATVIAQCVSVTLLLRCMCRMEGSCRLELKKLGINKEKAVLLLRHGLPAGLQGSVFSFSNVLIQSSINSFGSVAMAGSSAAANIEGFVYTAMNSFQQTALCFTSQNLGGGKYERINKILRNSLLMVSFVGIVMGGGCYLFGKQLLGIYSSDPRVIAYGIVRLRWICLPYFLCGLMDAMVGMLRGLGYAVVPMCVSIIGACGFRILWIATVFDANHFLKVLFSSYPISWILTGGTHVICFIVVWRKLQKKMKNHLI